MGACRVFLGIRNDHRLVIQLSEVTEFFTELMFGEGKWIGLILILSIIILVSAKNKYASILFLPIMIFLGIEYANNVSASSDFYWSVIICFITSVFLVVNIAVRKD